MIDLITLTGIIFPNHLLLRREEKSQELKRCKTCIFDLKCSFFVIICWYLLVPTLQKLASLFDYLLVENTWWPGAYMNF